jgi:hypothetical protein
VKMIPLTLRIDGSLGCVAGTGTVCLSLRRRARDRSRSVSRGVRLDGKVRLGRSSTRFGAKTACASMSSEMSMGASRSVHSRVREPGLWWGSRGSYPGCSRGPAGGEPACQLRNGRATPGFKSERLLLGKTGLRLCDDLRHRRMLCVTERPRIARYPSDSCHRPS